MLKVQILTDENDWNDSGTLNTTESNVFELPVKDGRRHFVQRLHGQTFFLRERK